MLRTTATAAAFLALAATLPTPQAQAQETLGGAIGGAILGGAIGGAVTGRAGGAARRLRAARRKAIAGFRLRRAAPRARRFDWPVRETHRRPARPQARPRAGVRAVRDSRLFPGRSHTRVQLGGSLPRVRRHST